MGLAGDFREITFSDVVQLYCHSRRTAKLVVDHPRTGKLLGVFYFEHGELVDAKLGDSEGLEAVYRALELKEGTFHVVLDVRAPERRIFEPVGALLLEGMRRMDEAGRLLPPSREAALKLVPAAGDTDPGEGKFMASPEPKGRTCPICRKRFLHGDVCPDDGVRLELASAELLPPARTVPPQPALSRRSSLPRGWWVALLVGVLIVLGLGALLLGRTGTSTVAETERRLRPAMPTDTRPEAPAPAAAATGTRTESPPAPAPAASKESPPAAAAVQPAPSPAQPAPAPPASGLRGVSDKEIVFGMAAPFTGSAKELGRQMKLGVETAFNAMNEAGGVHGRQLRLVALDDGYEPTRTADVMQDLYEKSRVFGIIGNVGTPTAAVAVPFALERKMLFYGAFTGAPLLRRDPPDRYVFNYRASYTEETAAVVKYLLKVKRLKPEQIAVFAQQDGFGDAGFAGVAKAMRGMRAEGNILRLHYKRNTIDVADAVAKLREHTVAIRAVVMVATYRPAAKFIEKVREINPTMIFTNVSFVGSTALAEELNLLGPKFASGVIVTQVVPPVDSYSTAILKYKAALAKYFPGENPDYVSLEGYIAANVLLEGLRRAGPKLENEIIIDALESIHDLDLGLGTLISYGPTEHQGSHKIWGAQLDEKGKYQVLDLE